MAYAKPSAQHLVPNKYYLIYDLSNDKGIYNKWVYFMWSLWISLLLSLAKAISSSLHIIWKIKFHPCLCMLSSNFMRHFLESESHSVVSDSLWPHGLYSLWNSPGQNMGMGSLSLLQVILPTQGSNPGLLYHRWIPYQMSHKGSPLFS